MIRRARSATARRADRRLSAAATVRRQLLGVVVASVATHIALAWINMFRQDADRDRPSTDRAILEADRTTERDNGESAAVPPGAKWSLLEVRSDRGRGYVPCSESGYVPRRAYHRIELSDEQGAELVAIAGRLTAPFREVQRARIVLYAAEGLLNKEIAARLDTAPEVVAKWRRRFCEEGVEGLKDRPRAGRPRRFPPARGGAGQGGRVRAAQQRGPSALALLPR